MTSRAPTPPGTLAALAAMGVVLGAIATSSTGIPALERRARDRVRVPSEWPWALPAFAIWGLAGGLGARGVAAGRRCNLPATRGSVRLKRVSSAIRIPSEPRDRLLLVLCGVFFAGDLAALHAAVNLTTAANAILFLNAQPIYVSIGAWLLFGSEWISGSPVPSRSR